MTHHPAFRRYCSDNGNVHELWEKFDASTASRSPKLMNVVSAANSSQIEGNAVDLTYFLNTLTNEALLKSKPECLLKSKYLKQHLKKYGLA